MGDVLNIVSGKIYNADNMHVLSRMETECIDLIYVDPPVKADLQFPAFRAVNPLHGGSQKGYVDFMADRLSEMKRVLKPTGSIYLHCQSEGSHYFKVLMDSLFEEKNFQNEIIWKKTGSYGALRRWAPVHDVILFYKGRGRHRWNRTFQEYPPEYVEKYYRYEDERGRYQLVSLTGPGVKESDSGKPWRGVDPTELARHWSVPNTALQKAYPERSDLGGLTAQYKLDLLDAAGLVHWPIRGKIPRQKRYLDEAEGIPLQDVITDIPPLPRRSSEYGGFLGQKPLQLLERIISASPNPGDLVLDPFCGSGTACVAAKRLGRDWVGIDIDERAVHISRQRLGI